MLKNQIITRLKKAIGQKSFEPESFISESERFGHYSTNAALKIAKIKKKNPLQVAEEITRTINSLAPKNFFEKVEIAAPGFINFWLSEETLANELKQIIKQGGKYGGSNTGKNKTIIIDYSAPNVAKPMNVGHLRSTLIGQSLADILRFSGYKVIGDNHLGDWGTQFGALIAAYKKWGKKSKLDKNPIDYLVKLYIRFHKESKRNDGLIVLAREETKKLQQGDSESRKLWKLFVKESLIDFNRIYKRLGIKFDVILSESFYNSLLSRVVADAIRKNVAQFDDGAVKVLYKDDRLSPLVIQKSDESYLYSTTDLAAIKYRVKKWKPTKILYVVANEQTLHFEQIFEASERLGYEKKEKLAHVKFGMVLGETGKKMSTRRGQYIKLEELLDKAVSKAAKINKKVSEVVGIGAIKYQTLSRERKSDIVFDWNQMLALHGNSGPYLQYTYARLKSVLRKAHGSPRKTDFLLLKEPEEKAVMRQLIYFPEIVERAAERYETNIIADYLFKLANTLNLFYERLPILKAEKLIRENRLNLIITATIVLKNGLKLLGIETPEKM